MAIMLKYVTLVAKHFVILRPPHKKFVNKATMTDFSRRGKILIATGKRSATRGEKNRRKWFWRMNLQRSKQIL